MPYKRRGRSRRRSSRRRGLATRPKMIPRGLARKRYQQISTKVFYFKTVGYLNSDTNGIMNSCFPTLEYVPAAGGLPSYYKPNVPFDYDRVAACYNEYKCLGISVKFIPAGVGTEATSGAPVTTLPVIPLFRGNTVSYIDQDVDIDTPAPDSILDVVTLGSAKSHNNRRQFTRSMFRAKGNPIWGNCDHNIAIHDRTPDSWFGSICFLANDCTPARRKIWYWVATWKIIFRGRNYTPP